MKNESSLYKKLIEYGKSDYYGFHMPGHKRQFKVIEENVGIDITEIDGFDNLHNPTGILKEEMDEAAKYYKSKASFFLVNGSTCGNMAAISSVVSYGDKIIIGRNSHKSVYNTVELLGLQAEYLYPAMIEGQDIFGQYQLNDVINIIKENNDAKAIVITSPTYEGVVSDIEGICKIAHKYDIPVIVDAAHGAHFILGDMFPKDAISCGADIVIESLHKTLPSLTQTAILHYNSNIVDVQRLKKYLGVYQSSSPSYMMMASISNCLAFMKNDGRDWATKLERKLDEIRVGINSSDNFIMLDKYMARAFDYDKSKLVIMIKSGKITGKELKDILNNRYHIELEMAASNYVLAMTSVCDNNEGFERLKNAVLNIDRDLGKENTKSTGSEHNKIGVVYSLRNDKFCDIHLAKDCDNKEVAKNYTCLYPPGIPLVVPGEIPAPGITEAIDEYKSLGYDVIEWR